MRHDELVIRCNACRRQWAQPDPLRIHDDPVDPWRGSQATITITVMYPENGCWRCHDIAKRIAKAYADLAQETARQLLDQVSAVHIGDAETRPGRPAPEPSLFALAEALDATRGPVTDLTIQHAKITRAR